MHATDIVAYAFQAAIHCPSCTHDWAQGTDDESVEQALDRAALRMGVDRNDERSYDSDDFPKVVFADQANDETWDHCDGCGDCIAHDESDCEAPSWDEAIERFEATLNLRGDIRLGLHSGQITVQPSYALRSCDPTAYRTSFNDWAHFEGIDTDKLWGEDRLPE